MKTKLLKKIRKRFSIIYNPEGHWCFGEYFPNNLYRFHDSNKIYPDYVSNNLDELKTLILRYVRKEYSHLGQAKKINLAKKDKKVWWTQK